MLFLATHRQESHIFRVLQLIQLFESEFYFFPFHLSVKHLYDEFDGVVRPKNDGHEFEYAFLYHVDVEHVFCKGFNEYELV